MRESAARVAEVVREQKLAGPKGVIIDVPSGTDQTVSFDKFAWAQEDYNESWRGAQTWAFFITVRATLASLDQKWTYLGAWSSIPH